MSLALGRMLVYARRNPATIEAVCDHAECDGVAQATPVPAPVHDSIPGCLQRQSVQAGDGPVRDLFDLQRCPDRTGVQRGGDGPVDAAVHPVLRARGAIGGQPRQGADHPHREDRGDRHHAGRRGRADAGDHGIYLRRYRDDVRLRVSARHAFDVLRPNQICDPAAASADQGCARRDRAGRGGHVYRYLAGHDSRRLHLGRTRRDRRDRGGRDRLAERSSGRARAARRTSPRARLEPLHRILAADQRDDAHPAAVSRDPRDQLLLDDRRGADHHLPAAGERTSSPRRRRSRACSPRRCRSGSQSDRW